jgi:hypothetical protein
VALAYPGGDPEVAADAELCSYWKNLDARGTDGKPRPYGLPQLSAANLVDQLTHTAWYVTAGHEVYGMLRHVSVCLLRCMFNSDADCV